jgi:hypothetical protein
MSCCKLRTLGQFTSNFAQLLELMVLRSVYFLVKFRFFIQELWERKSLQILYECWRRAYHALLAQLFIIFCFYFQSHMGRVFIFCFYFQRFKNITQTSSILLFWQTNNTIVFTLSTGRIVHRAICLERNCTLKLTRKVFSLVAMLNFYFRYRLISHSNVCQNSSMSPACLKT